MPRPQYWQLENQGAGLSRTAVLGKLADIVGARHVLTAAESKAPYEVDERQLYRGDALAIVRPGGLVELSAAMALCYGSDVAMVPHGGNTGYCGGATPSSDGSQVVISLERINRVVDVDSVGMTLTVEAGVTLERAQQAAADAGMLLPLSMGSQATCQIGGNLSTNAGGLAVLRYGTTRDLVLGLTAVMPDGSIVDRASGLRKDNTGYDLKQLFMGAEGSLGIISQAVLKLFPRPMQCFTVWLVLPSLDTASAALSTIRRQLGDNVTSYEYMSGRSLGYVAEMFPDFKAVYTERHPHQALLELSMSEGEQDRLAAVLSQLASDALIEDAVVAQSESQRAEFWAWREHVPAAERHLGGSIKHDVSVRLGQIARFTNEAARQVQARWPDARLSVYGHVGDGNVHFNVLAPTDTDATQFRQQYGEAVSAVIHDLAVGMGGSFSAEHGVGQLKRELLSEYASPETLTLMRAIKTAFDPKNLMNPGKVI